MWLNKKNKKAITMTQNKRKNLKSKKILLMKISLKRLKNRENQRYEPYPNL